MYNQEICGNCGSNEDLKLKIIRNFGYNNEGEPNESMYDEAVLCCGNCGTNHYLTELNDVTK